MAQLLRQSTVKVFRIGPFVDETDGHTAEVALVIAQADIQISKAGGAFAQTSAAAPTTTHDMDGWYQCPLTATDTNTLGTLDVQVTMAGALPVWAHFLVVPANVYDSLVAGSDYLDVEAAAIAADAVAEIQSGLATPGDIPAMITQQQVRDAMKLDCSDIPGPVPGSVDMQLGDIYVEANNHDANKADVSGLATSIALAAHDAKLDTVDTNVDSIITTLAALPAAVWTATTRTLTSFGTALAGVAQAVWEYVKRELTQSPEDVAAAVGGTNLTIVSAVTYDYTLTGLVIPADWKKIWVTMKTKRTDDDEDSIVQIVESNPGVAADGLLYLNGAAGTAAQASLTVNQVAGTIAIHIDDEATAELARWTGGYDVKVLDAAGDTSQIRSAKVSVTLTETHAIA